MTPTLEGQSLTFQTPILPLSWDVSVRETSMGKSCNLCQKIDGTDNALAFQRWLEQLTELFKTQLREHGEAWAHTDLETKKVNNLSMMTPPKASTFNGMTAFILTGTLTHSLLSCRAQDNMSLAFTPKLVYDREQDVILTVTTDSFGNKLDPNQCLKRGARVIAICTVNYLYLGKSGSPVSINCEVQKLCVFPVSDGSNVSFDLEADDEVKSAVASVAPKTPPGTPPAKRARLDFDFKVEEDDDV